MNNADSPASPITNDVGVPVDITDETPDAGYWEQEGRVFSTGLTKREHFAAKAMDSVQAFILAQHDADAYSEDQFIDMCVKRANKLLAALNQPQGE